MQRNWFPIITLLLLLFAYGCETDRGAQELIQPQIHLLMVPALAQGAPPTVEIAVTDAEGTRIYDNPERLGERSFIFDIDVVPGEVTISITMTYEDGSVVTGSKQIQITSEKNIINFSLDLPNQLAIGIDSDESFPIRRDEDFLIYLYIQNVKDLYGATIRLRFDEKFISPVEITPGTFWGAETTDFIWIHDLANHRANELNLAFTRLRNSFSSQGRAKLVHVKFKAKQATSSQPTMISFIVDDSTFTVDNNPRVVFRLKTQDGTDVDGFSDLKAVVAKREYPVDIR